VRGSGPRVEPVGRDVGRRAEAPSMSPERRRIAIFAGTLAALSASTGVTTSALHAPHWIRDAALGAIVVAEVLLIVFIARRARNSDCAPAWMRLRAAIGRRGR
jgi:hypothetical protein